MHFKLKRFFCSVIQIYIHTLKNKSTTRKTFAASPGQTADEELEAQPGETVRLLLSYKNRIIICHFFKRASFKYFAVNSLNAMRSQFLLYISRRSIGLYLIVFSLYRHERI